jgi:hypothetical protein
MSKISQSMILSLKRSRYLLARWPSARNRTFLHRDGYKVLVGYTSVPELGKRRISGGCDIRVCPSRTESVPVVGQWVYPFGIRCWCTTRWWTWGANSQACRVAHGRGDAVPLPSESTRYSPHLNSVGPTLDPPGVHGQLV